MYESIVNILFCARQCIKVFKNLLTSDNVKVGGAILMTVAVSDDARVPALIGQGHIINVE